MPKLLKVILNIEQVCKSIFVINKLNISCNILAYINFACYYFFRLSKG